MNEAMEFRVPALYERDYDATEESSNANTDSDSDNASVYWSDDVSDSDSDNDSIQFWDADD